MIDLVAERSPLGGLERWLDDPEIDEVLVNSGREVWVDRGGRLDLVGQIRTSTLLAVIEHLLAPTGRRVDRSQPVVDARLADGSRLCAALEPIAVDGPCLAIRRLTRRRFDLSDFAGPAVVETLHQLIGHRVNILVSGATSSGKTSLLGALLASTPADARLVTMEDVAELPIVHPHVVRLETRPATPDGVGELELSDLLRAALRLRPDRVVVGEIRGTEAIHLLHALNTGHDGSMSTIHANSADDAITRLCALVVQSAANWPLAAVHDHVARAIDVIVHVERGADGRRSIREVVELDRKCRLDGVATRLLVADGVVTGQLTRGRR